MRWLASLIVVATLLAPSFASADAGVVRFARRTPGDVVVPVTIDGQGPFRMLLDTGATRSAVTAAVAARLASRTMGATEMVTPAGAARRTLILLKGVIVGRVGPQSVVGLQLEAGDLRQGDIDGLIGQDLLSRAPFTIDYGAGTLRWDPPAAVEFDATRIPLEVVDGRLVARLDSSAGRLRLIVDSGADRLVLFPREGTQLPDMTIVGFGRLWSTAGRRSVGHAVIDKLAVGTVVFRELSAALVDRAHPALEDGLLPLHLFSRVTVDGPRGYLSVHK